MNFGAPPWADYSVEGDMLHRRVEYMTFGEVTPERRSRITRLEPHIHTMRAGVPLMVTMEELTELMTDLKTEGNDLFKEKNYFKAQQFYTMALNNCYLMRDEYQQRVENDFVSALYCNRAACALKLDEYKQAVDDSDMALSVKPDNIKAYYRKASALKKLKEYRVAEMAAKEGIRRSISQDKTSELETLLKEIQIHIEPLRGTGASSQSKSNNKDNKNSSKVLTKSAKKRARKKKAKKNQEKENTNKSENRKTMNKETNNNTTKDTSNSQLDEKGDGKNNRRRKRQREKKKKSKTKSKTLCNTANKFAQLESSESESDLSSECSDESDESESDESSEEESDEPGASWDSMVPDVRPTNGNMGLDDFSPIKTSNLASNFQDFSYLSTKPDPALGAIPKVPPPTKMPPPNTKIGPPPINVGPPGAMPRVIPPNPNFSMPPPPTRNPYSVPPVPGMAPPARPHKLVSTDFPVLSPPYNLQEPFRTQYDFTLVCSQCFIKVGHGMAGYRKEPGIKHPCPRDTLLVRTKNKFDDMWKKIRPRLNVQFEGVYRLCQHFIIGHPCKVEEDRCIFPHCEEEMEIWDMERHEAFDLKEFVEEMRQIVFRGAMRKFWPDQVGVREDYPIPTSNTYMPQATPYQPPPSGIPPLLPTPNIPPPPISKPALLPTPTMPPKTDASLTGGKSSDSAAFPLKDSHIFRLVCNDCLQQVSIGKYMAMNIPTHNCPEDVIAVCLIGQQYWLKIRQRSNHRVFLGKYRLCHHYTANPPHECGVPEDMCSFAHSVAEQELWTLEKDGSFNYQEFVLQQRSSQQAKQFTVDDLLHRHKGQFEFLCRACFFGMASRISLQHPERLEYCSSGQHIWKDNKYFVHVNGTGGIVPIEPRPFKGRDAFFRLCHKMRYCLRRETTSCFFAHSMVERDVWLVERDTEITRDEIHDASLALYRTPPAAPTPESSVSDAQSERDTSSPKKVVPPTQPTPVNQSNQNSKPTASKEQAPPTRANQPIKGEINVGPPTCPYKVKEFCGLCWKNGNYSTRDRNEDRCTLKGMGHMWSMNKMVILIPEKKEIRALPKKLPKNCNFKVCQRIQEKKKCTWNMGGPCPFAHCEEEIDVWTWMVHNKVTSLDALVKSSIGTQQRLSNRPQPAQTSSASTTKPQPTTTPATSWPKAKTNAPVPFHLLMNSHYCHYCSVQCNSQRQWEQHCASNKHMFNVNSDKEHQWNYRQPPWGLPTTSYTLCYSHQEGKCKYSHVPDMYNQCQYAHSSAELEEWRERAEWRQMKRDIARREKLYSYMDALLEEYEVSGYSIAVISESTPGIEILCRNELKVCLEDKHATYDWKFVVKTDIKNLPLSRIALLHNTDRLHFNLVGPDIDSGCQIVEGSVYLTNGSYEVDVRFSGGIFGSFMQWVAFDFGRRPVIVRKLSVELGTLDVHEKVLKLRESLHFKRWTTDNVEIVRLDNMTPQDMELLQKYPTPTSSDTVITQDSVTVGVNSYNYVHKMHKLLQIEELTRQRIIASYNLKAELELRNRIEEQTFIFAHRGELFARVPLSDELNEDTDAGKLILSSVSKVLVAPQARKIRKVYEACIVNKESFDLDGKGKDYVYLCFSQRLVGELNLSDGDMVSMEIQFQMDRVTFCRMHYAVDNVPLDTTNIIFPDYTKAMTSDHVNHCLEIKSDILNDEQKLIVRHLLADRSSYSPPFVTYGPFGTGKTESLAYGVMALVQNKPESKVLICTHSNSAADLFITKHLDTFVQQNNKRVQMVRVYFTGRRVSTVTERVQRYCLFEPSKHMFRAPCRADLVECNIVVTTIGECYSLHKLGVQGVFSHIVIDEAAQDLESHMVLPLTLANKDTCVIIAGDHMQMNPKIYSQEARDQGFHYSLLERLYRHQEIFAHQVDKDNPLCVLLNVNYRSKMEIVRYISAVFYGGPDRLRACSSLPDVAGIVPLTFYTAQGHEVQESTSYYNMAEAEEVVDRVQELLVKWPVEKWGERKADEIGVITPYQDQVVRIRKLLRQRHPELRKVCVERVMNVQGKEFRAVFISTVRTRNLAEKAPVIRKGMAECDGDVGDFGFLSDTRLLNTALTRAQSLVAVIGDPVSLCAIGECMHVWRTYIKHCQKLGSIEPESVTLDSVKAQVIALMRSPLGKNIMMLNNEEAPVERGEVPLGGTREDAVVMEAVEGSTKDEVVEDSIQQYLMEDWNMDFRIEPDEVIKQLALESLKEMSPNSKKRVDINPNEPVALECIRVKAQQEGPAVVSYKKKKRFLMSADNCEDHYESDEDQSDSEDDDDVTRPFKDYSKAQLNELLQKLPARYKHCTLHISSSSSMYAKVIAPDSHIKEIKIGSRQRCGQAFDGDEVVVQILPADETDNIAHKEQNQPLIHGQVIGILKRIFNPKYRMFVCLVEERNTGLMVPLNRGMPKIFNLNTQERANQASDDEVAVYRFTKNREIIFDRFEKVDRTNSQSKLFIVRYLKWEKDFVCPLGIVVGVLQPGDTVERAREILNIEHFVPRRFNSETLAEVNQQYPATYVLPTEVTLSRRDMRGSLAFTVDPEGSTDLDDAISIEPSADGMYVVGVHITDVSHFVTRGSNVDLEANKRGTSWYPAGRPPIPMMPERLSSDLCSLLPNTERLSLSILMTVSPQAQVVSVKIAECLIQSKYKLTYSDVESILSNSQSQQTYSHDLKICLLILSQMAQTWRLNRLGNASVHQELDPDSEQTPKAHKLIEEIMLMANHQVALYLKNKYPDLLPLRNQLPPNIEELEEWKSEYSAEAHNAVILTKPYLNPGQICQCTNACTCIPHDSELEYMEVQATIWQHIFESVMHNQTDTVQKFILSARHHPQLAVALAQLMKLHNKAQYITSAEIKSEERGHYGLNLYPYLQFTSPLRRYTDLVVHRLVKAALSNSPNPYTREELISVCNHCTYTTINASLYEKATRSLYFSSMLKDQPNSFFAIVQKFDNSSIQLQLPALYHLAAPNTQLKISLLFPADKPEVTEEADELQITWQERIYDVKLQRSVGPCDPVGQLNPDRFVVQMPVDKWQALLHAVQRGDVAGIVPAFNEANSSLICPAQSDQFVTHLSSERDDLKRGSHYVSFALDIVPSTIIKVQMTTKIIKGVMRPSLQLLNLTNNLDICLEHRQDPIDTFSYSTSVFSSKPQYANILAYQNAWLPLVAMEGAQTAVNNEESIIIHGVSILWRRIQQTPNDRPQMLGTFRLPLHFCIDRQIDITTGGFLPDPDDNTDQTTPARKPNIPLTLDYLCVRYPRMPTRPQTNHESDITIDTKMPMTWVGHAVVMKAEQNEELGAMEVDCRIHQNSSALPTPVIAPKAGPPLATLEWIPKTQPIRYMDAAIRKLENAPQLAKDIALGKKPSACCTDEMRQAFSRIIQVELHSFKEANDSQQSAILQALSEPFTLIQGPPGTGKTETGVRLAFLYAMVNQALGTPGSGVMPPQVLYCGPSNKSVDVVTGYFLRLASECPSIVRVYSTRIEQEEFPLPCQVIPSKKHRQILIQPGVKKVALHHMIRDPVHTSHASFISKIDAQIHTNPDSVTESDLSRYKVCIGIAKREVLGKAKIVLCTCVTAGSSTIIQATHIKQLIIDEAGMCMEPESMIPVINTGPEQVVLIGDHKQLQPIVLQEKARMLGLQTSMFERYSGKSTMLVTQYRMHKAIAEFPSQQFYDSKLVCGLPTQNQPSLINIWPGGNNQPIMFVHVVGREDTLSVATSEGNVQSRSNDEEASVAVQIISSLKRTKGIPSSDLIVLSQYQAQCTKVKHLLEEKALADIDVSTVVASQGSEWDYVVLSCVRSLPVCEIETWPSRGWKKRNLGFIIDDHQINVAITRARKGLIIIGNKNLLDVHPMWRDLLKQYKQKRALIDRSQLKL